MSLLHGYNLALQNQLIWCNMLEVPHIKIGKLDLVFNLGLFWRYVCMLESVSLFICGFYWECYALCKSLFWKVIIVNISSSSSCSIQKDKLSNSSLPIEMLWYVILSIETQFFFFCTNLLGFTYFLNQWPLQELDFLIFFNHNFIFYYFIN